MFCRVLERLLRRDGFEPQFAANGEEALSLLSGFKSYAPKAIVSDLHMPVMNGEEFLRKVRSNTAFAAVPFIMLTSDEDVNAEVSLLARGADAFVSKNRDPRVLCAHIRRLTRSDSILEAA
jgi:two-component system NtrC family sensor kinase